MPAADPLPLEKARTLALKVMDVLRPACVQIETAGSIRRGRPMVGDIDLVCLPRPEQGAAEELARLFATCAEMGGMMTNGGFSKRCLLRKSRFQCDLWIAHHNTGDLFAPLPCNWGAMLLTYTGSPAHNMKVVARAKELGHTFRPGHGVVEESGRVHSVTEAEIFEVLQWDFVEPKDRF